MQLNDIYICALKELEGFDEDAIEKAILLAKNDVVETVEEFIDFINFNIEENKFPHIVQPFEERIIKQAVEKARNNEGRTINYVDVTSSFYPQKLLQAKIGTLSPLSYKGNLKIVTRKTIMITGSSSVTNNAKLASKYYGKILASNGYNILSSLSEGCELNSILGCSEVSGTSTFFLPHSIEHLSSKEKKIIQRELETGRSTVISASKLPQANNKTIEESYRYLMAICDCIIVPQLSSNDIIMQFILKCLEAKKPVFFIKYKTGDGSEYDSLNNLSPLGVKFLSSNTALEQIKETIGYADDSNIY